MSVEDRLKEVLDRLKQLEAKVSPPPPPRHEHKLAEAKDGGVFCVDCGDRFYRISSFDDVLERLKRHHEGEGDFLSCPSCRPKFVKALTDLGYEVREYGGEVRIRRKKR